MKIIAQTETTVEKVADADIYGKTEMDRGQTGNATLKGVKIRRRKQ